MLCEKCKKRTATVFYNENINGKVRSYSLCGDCAAKLREKGDLQDITSILENYTEPFSLLHDNIFGGFFGIPTGKSLSSAKKCPSCGCTYAEFEKTGKVGCSVCYDIFSQELSRMIQSVHGTTSHVGGVPAKHRARRAREDKLEELNKGLQAAIEAENYENAAKIRDEIRQLKKEADEKGEA